VTRLVLPAALVAVLLACAQPRGPGDTDASDLHADFELGTGGETLALLDPLGAVADTVAFPALAAYEAYAREPDGREWATTVTPTPGGANTP